MRKPTGPRFNHNYVIIFSARFRVLSGCCDVWPVWLQSHNQSLVAFRGFREDQLFIAVHFAGIITQKMWFVCLGIPWILPVGCVRRWTWKFDLFTRIIYSRNGTLIICFILAYDDPGIAGSIQKSDFRGITILAGTENEWILESVETAVSLKYKSRSNITENYLSDIVLDKYAMSGRVF